MEQEIKVCQNCKKEFVIEPDDFAFYEKIKVPAPTFCPECRLVRRLAWRNERTLHRHTCAKCSKSIISIFSPDSKFVVYCNPCWWGDDWDATDYGINFNPKKPFLAQFQELLHKVPVPSLYGLYTTLVNSDYTNMVSYLKNCYMITYSDYSENVTYGSFVNHTKDSVDNLMLEEGELCYDTINCNKCYKTFYSQDCKECNNIYFSKNCIGCQNCFGCVNLKNQKYCVYNNPVSKEDFEKFVKENTTTWNDIVSAKGKAREFWLKFPNKYMHGIRNNNVSGDYIFDSKNTLNSYCVGNAEDCKFCSFVTSPGLKDAYDFINFGINSSLLYEVMQSGDQASRIRFAWWAVTNCYDIEYSAFSVGSKNIFGSMGMNKKEYCILNKKYPQEEYYQLRQTIIDQMNNNPYIDDKGRIYRYGEFFPVKMSPFGYNETTAQEFFPLEKDKAEKLGFNWRDVKQNNYDITLQPEVIPDIEVADDSITNEIIGCIHAGKCKHQCSKAFRMVPQELQFYRQLKIPIPRLCPNCRHGERIEQRNPMKLWHRQCMCNMNHSHHSGKCLNEFETSYSPDRPEIVYCEQCYNTEVA
ncbi:MAG: hypothetical protein NTY81_01970 [Candidatus Staskawiczbacteria bacterium]|nr:hypothetical protein [Candidatus Staskawiczbacteria bacterium]